MRSKGLLTWLSITRLIQSILLRKSLHNRANKNRIRSIMKTTYSPDSAVRVVSGRSFSNSRDNQSAEFPRNHEPVRWDNMRSYYRKTLLLGILFLTFHI